MPTWAFIMFPRLNNRHRILGCLKGVMNGPTPGAASALSIISWFALYKGWFSSICDQAILFTSFTFSSSPRLSITQMSMDQMPYIHCRLYARASSSACLLCHILYIEMLRGIAFNFGSRSIHGCAVLVSMLFYDDPCLPTLESCFKCSRYLGVPDSINLLIVPASIRIIVPRLL